VTDRFRTARWVRAEELDEGRWHLRITDEADDELGSFTIGVEGAWDPDVRPYVTLAVTQLGLRYRGSRPWRLDETGAHRAAVLPD
jgi:hypothetical protein